MSFKDASTMIGRSLVSEFSELDSTDSVSGEDAMNVSLSFLLIFASFKSDDTETFEL